MTNPHIVAAPRRAPSISLSELEKFRPCSDRLEAIKPAFKGRPLTARRAVKAGATLDDLVWIAAACARKDKDVERRLRMWMADCAARVLHIYEKSDGATSKPRDAIIAARAFANGEIDAAATYAAGDAARDDAWDAARDAAKAVARAAAMGAAAKAVDWNAARAAARGVARAAAWDAARDAARYDDLVVEERWQIDRLVAWLSGREPKPLALPPIPKHMQEVA